MSARTLMLQGTGSSVGKSTLTAALCRVLLRRGLSVAPFKSQNMALNSAVTPDGREIGRAQAVQAQACGLLPRAEMNPILLKPEGEARSQVVVLGERWASLGARDYHELKPRLREVVADSLATLRARHDVVIIEGAGSPAEINLRDRDLVNMFVAHLADAPVLLVGDIDRGGVFAALVGTLVLLDDADRARVRGFLINKFRGDVGLLMPGLDMLEERTGVKTYGVIHHLRDLGLPDEDSLDLDDRVSRGSGAAEKTVAVVRLPRISNFDDFDPLQRAPGVRLVFVDRAAALRDADLVILPGSKSTMSDLAWLRERGLAEAIVARARAGRPVLGVCGGCQMLGERIDDPHRIEGASLSMAGLGLLPLVTRFGAEKRVALVECEARGESFLRAPGRLSGYEIHMGRVERTARVAPAFAVNRRNGAEVADSDGAVSADGAVVGTMLHGVLANPGVLERLLGRLGLASATPPAEDPFERLADAFEKSVPTEKILGLLGR
jgi:adenosylcobyric acid synthase